MDDEEERRKCWGSTRVVPASAGWYVVGLIYDNTHRRLDWDRDVYRDAIVAWGISEQEGCYPITLEWTKNYLEDREGVLAPDGSITIPQDCKFENDEAYLRFLQEHVNRREMERKKA